MRKRIISLLMATILLLVMAIIPATSYAMNWKPFEKYEQKNTDGIHYEYNKYEGAKRVHAGQQSTNSGYNLQSDLAVYEWTDRNEALIILTFGLVDSNANYVDINPKSLVFYIDGVRYTWTTFSNDMFGGLYSYILGNNAKKFISALGSGKDVSVRLTLTNGKTYDIDDSEKCGNMVKLAGMINEYNLWQYMDMSLANQYEKAYPFTAK